MLSLVLTEHYIIIKVDSDEFIDHLKVESTWCIGDHVVQWMSAEPLS